ncbi:MAG: TldD/PmbA family protein [Candidatus Omnitrophica bacterium]|nr:TldD/PmbA family protein [Candidatus Omnitrophota bacterium]
MLLGESRIVSALKRAAAASPADETLIAAQRESFTTLRFAGERIHQSFQEEEVTVWVKVAVRGRIGVATTCSLSHEALMKAIESAMTITRVAVKPTASASRPTASAAKPTTPPFSSAPPKIPTPRLTTYFPGTAHRPLTEIVPMIQHLWKTAGSVGVSLAGSFVRGEEELAVAGSRGLAQYQPFSIAGLRLVPTKGKASGFAAQVSRDLGVLEPEPLLERALRLCRMNEDPKEIPVGKYDVLLEPEAVSELLEWLGYIGFGAKQVTERTSFMAGRMGERIMGRGISISDDGANPEGLAVPFDYEGIPKQQVPLIRQGVASGIVYDSHYARLHRHGSTGHAGSYDQFEGPLPTNLFLAAGDPPAAELIRKMDRGLWIGRFHYVSGLLNTQEALMTGLTRDGTFLIKKGKVAGAVKNLRFTQSILEAFSKVAAVSRERRLVADPSQGLSAAVCPALLIQDFTFTGQTK